MKIGERKGKNEGMSDSIGEDEEKRKKKVVD
jgi:hypothetical protein